MKEYRIPVHDFSESGLGLGFKFKIRVRVSSRVLVQGYSRVVVVQG
jgi:hypothetical protein